MPPRTRRRRPVVLRRPAEPHPVFMSADEYAQIGSRGSVCPLCRGQDIEAAEADQAINTVYVCSRCGSQWQSAYRVSGYRMLSLGRVEAVVDPNKSDDPYEH